MTRIRQHSRRQGRPAIYDQATTWYEAWYFSLRLAEEVFRAQRHGLELGIVGISIANVGQPLSARRMDLNGALTEAASSLRATDIPGVVDGGRFAVALPHTDRLGAQIVLERLSKFLEPFDAVLGLCVYPKDASEAEELLAKSYADRPRNPFQRAA